MAFSLRTLGLVALPWVGACSGSADKPSTPDDPTVDSGSVTTPTDHTGTATGHTGTVEHTATTTPSETGLPAGLIGTPPAAPLGLASFSEVTNRSNQVMSPSDLVGHPTVMWFYPAANTGG